MRVNWKGARRTRVFNTAKAAQDYATKVKALLKLGKVDEVFQDPAPPAAALPPVTFQVAAERWLALDGAALKVRARG